MSASDSYGKLFAPELAVDESILTGWHSLGGSSAWWRIDFQTVRWISRGWIHNTMWKNLQRFAGFKIWVGVDSSFPGTNTLKYTSGLDDYGIEENFTVEEYCRYLYVSNTINYFSFDELGLDML